MLASGGIAWTIKVLGVTFVVMWIHSLGSSIGVGSSEVGLEWGARTCGAFP